MHGLDPKGVAAVAAAFVVIAVGVAAAGAQDEPPIGGTVRKASATTEPSATATPTTDSNTTGTAETEGTPAQVSGVVRSGGTPIGGVAVTLVADGEDGRTVDEALTSANGSFTLSAIGDEDSSYVVSANDPAGEHATATSSPFTLDRDRRITITMSTTAVVDGTVVADDTTDAVVGASVEVTDSDGERHTANTDGAGHFRLSGIAPGPVTITVRTPDGDDVTIKRTIVAGANRVDAIIVPIADPDPTPEPDQLNKPGDGVGFTDQNEDPVNNS